MSTNGWEPKKSWPISATLTQETPKLSLESFLPKVPQVLPPEPPKPPALFELVDPPTSPSSMDRPSGGLFQELLQGRPEAMYLDSLDSPDKYDEDLRKLLSELVSTGRRPSFEEHKKLDAAVLTFMEAPRAKAAPPPKPALPKKLPEFKRPEFTGGDEEVPGPEPALGSGGNPRPFWWL